MSISSITTASPSTYLSSSATSVSGSSASPVVASTDAGLAQQASALSSTADIVANFGSSSSTSDLTYNAAGLYNSIAQAGTTTSSTPTITVPASGSNTQAAAQQSTDSSIVSTLPQSNTASGFYTGSGVLQSTSSTSADLSSNWASALKANPNLSHVVAADSYAQGIVGTLSVTA